MNRIDVLSFSILLIFFLFSVSIVTSQPESPLLMNADYVIMTTNAIVENSEELEYFVNLKEFQGHNVRVVTEDEFDPNPGKFFNGRPEKMRQWLIDNKDELGIEYVLLIGDPNPDNPDDPVDSVGDIPMKWCIPKYHIWEEQDIPTDYYYADLSGNWDQDSDGIFGEMKPYDNPISPDPGNINSDYFSVWWGGSLIVEETGNYLFQIYCDDQVQLMIDGEWIIDHTGYSGPQPLTNKKNITHLEMGTHNIQLRYQEYNGDAVISLIWKPPNASHEDILPGTNLLNHKGIQGGLTGWYFNAIYPWTSSSGGGWVNPDLERGPEKINFFWGTGDQGPDGPKPGGDIYVGRIPVYDSNYGDLDHILRKNIDYQTDKYSSWREKILLPMANHSDTVPGYPLGEHIRNGIAFTQGFETFRIYDADFDVSPDLTPCSVDNTKNEWKKGYGMVVWATHGSETHAERVIDLSALPDLDDSKPSFTFQASCHNAFPENHHNLAYELLKYGAICTVASTRMSAHLSGDPSWPLNPESGLNHNLAYYYTEKITRYGMNAGQALYLTKADHPSVLDNAQMYNLYGDPSCYLLRTYRNESPLAYAGGPYLESEGSLIWFSAGTSIDPEGDNLEFRWDYNNDGIWDTEWSNSSFYYHKWNDDHIGRIKVQVRDELGFTDEDTASVVVMNECPLVDPGLTQVIVKDSQVSFFGSYIDSGVDDGPHTIFWDFGDGENVSDTLTPTHTFKIDGCYNVTFSVTDKEGEVGSALFYVGVSNGEVVVTDNLEDIWSIIPEFSSSILLIVSFGLGLMVLFFKKK